GEELVEEPKQVHEWLCRALGDTEPTYEYRGRRWTVRETIAETQTGAQHASAVDVTVERPLPTLEELDGAMPLPSGVCKHIQAVPRPATLRRRSATELMKLQRDSSGHRDAYVLGVPDRRLFTPDKHGNTPHGVPARIMGDLLHASLEEQLEDAALDEFHERELSARLDESVQSPRLQAAVRRLSAMVTIARSNPTVAALYDAPNSERELSFTWIRHVPGGAPALIHGAIDLVATLSGGEPEILDYKSHAIRAGDEEAKAAEYDLQRDLYVEALRAILGAAPRSFTFYFPETNTPITTDLSAETSEARLARIDQLLALDTAAR
ncbi:MAG: PD-(D/E)XK nuclease family protein, partial [Gemmatimonadaceae bacterium]